MPQYRRKGYGKELLRVMGAVAVAFRAPLRLWVSHADATLDNLVVVEKLWRHLCLQVRPSQERWASFSARE